jgi:aldehyde dehydrogenase (NAD+)
MKFDKIYVGGAWVEPLEGRGVFDVVNPADGTLVGQVPACGAADAAAAVAAAHAAFATWSRLPAAERGAVLAKAADLMAARAVDLARLITSEVGTPIKISQRIQVGLPIATWRRYADLALSHDFEDTIGDSRIIEVPVGVVACITPWNYPLHQISSKVAAALAAGCTVVLKPSEIGPLSAFALAEILHEAGLPPGVFNLVSGDGATVGEALATDPRVNMVSFTGSTRAGRRVAELAASTVKKVSLELGGKSAAVLLDDADLEQAVRSTVGSCMLNSGQTCSAITRLLVPVELYEEVRAIAAATAARFIPGDPAVEATRLGPLVSRQQQQRVLDFIRQGRESGAEIVAGGDDAVAADGIGWFVAPTIFGRVDPQSAIAQEEIFGPVLSIICYRDEDEAVAIANGTAYGLAGAVWSRNADRAFAVARRLRAGQIDVNGAAFNLDAPFGGFGQSGHGRENGIYGLKEFLAPISVQLPAGFSQVP